MIILIIPSIISNLEPLCVAFFIIRRMKISIKPLIINKRPINQVIANKFSSGKLTINTPITKKITPMIKLDHLIPEDRCINFTPKIFSKQYIPKKRKGTLKDFKIIIFILCKPIM